MGAIAVVYLPERQGGYIVQNLQGIRNGVWEKTFEVSLQPLVQVNGGTSVIVFESGDVPQQHAPVW